MAEVYCVAHERPFFATINRQRVVSSESLDLQAVKFESRLPWPTIYLLILRMGAFAGWATLFIILLFFKRYAIDVPGIMRKYIGRIYTEG
jgi:hypothetical protein